MLWYVFQLCLHGIGTHSPSPWLSVSCCLLQELVATSCTYSQWHLLQPLLVWWSKPAIASSEDRSFRPAKQNNSRYGPAKWNNPRQWCAKVATKGLPSFFLLLYPCAKSANWSLFNWRVVAEELSRILLKNCRWKLLWKTGFISILGRIWFMFQGLWRWPPRSMAGNHLPLILFFSWSL